MDKFLYLNEVDFIATWVNGGRVPLSLASSYLSVEREGTLTPDECRELQCPTDPESAWDALRTVFIGASPETCQIQDLTIMDFHNGPTWLTDRREDGLILCLSNSFDIAGHANRYLKDACVRIPDVGALKEALDSSLGAVSQMKECKYTSGHNRGPFLKSYKDVWQDESRLYWKTIKQNTSVELPPGLAVEHWRRTNEPRPERPPKVPQPAEPARSRRTNFIGGGLTIIPGPTRPRRRPLPRSPDPIAKAIQELLASRRSEPVRPKQGKERQNHLGKRRKRWYRTDS